MCKIALIGAGSSTFTRNLVVDVLSISQLKNGTLALVDIDQERLETSHKLVEKIISLTNSNWQVTASTDRLKVLKDSNYVINTIEVSGLDVVKTDYQIPLKYGIDQCIGDTIGPGGIFKALRTTPQILEILDDIEDLCPDAIFLNYTNPMAIITLAGLVATDVQITGLCHSVQNTIEQLAKYLDLPKEKLNWNCAGINHMSWLTELTADNVDCYPQLLENIKNPEIYEQDPVRFDMMQHFGYFVTESSGHFSEYVPYYRKRKDLLEKYTRSGYLGESGFYPNNWPKWRKEVMEETLLQIEGKKEIELKRSTEYASYIIEAVETNTPFKMYGNVLNNGLITNLPESACVEVACLVDRNGIQPTFYGTLPEHLAALNKQHISIHELVAEAVISFDLELAYKALLIDPLTAAVCSPSEIKSLFNEMVDSQKHLLKKYL